MADVLIEGVLVDEATGGASRPLTVEAYDTSGQSDVPHGRTTSDQRGRFAIRMTERLQEQLARRDLQVWFVVRSDQGVVANSRDQEVFWDPRNPNRVELRVPHIEEPNRPPVEPYEVRGQVLTDRGTPAESVMVEVWDHRLRGATLLGSGIPDGGGTYRVLYDPARLDGKHLGDIDVRVVDARRQQELARSKVAYQAPPRLEVDLVVPFTGVRRSTEYERLLTGLEPLLDGTSLTDVDADGVVFLANRSGWDPRSVAMAAEAARITAGTDAPAAHYYALFRSGAAPDAAAAHRLADTVVVQTIEAALAEGVIPDSGSIDATVRRHQGQAVEALMAYVPPGGVSSVDQMLDLRLDGSEKRIFVERLRATAGEPERLWDDLVEAGMSPAVVSRLQTDGKLGHLTLQNAPLISRLANRAGVEATADLVTAGFYEPEPWIDLIGNDVPAGLTRQSYAVGMAAHVRLAYPTLVTADLVRRERVMVGGPDVAGPVADFLAQAGPEHTLGRVPVATWPGFDDLAATVRDSVQTVERIYQITPSDGSMETLSRLGIGSARQIAQYSSAEFLATYGDAFPTTAQAALVHQKAQEVHSAALTLATAYLTRRGAAHVYALDGPLSGPAPGGQAVPAVGPSAASATLENLFGNLDYCACEHCRSVLGPAAYLVDLLEFLDLADVTHDLANPITVLLDRRPDIQHIVLSCENTNVALPYIDIVNEILEHFIVNGDLVGFEGHDTAPGTTTADLLVDPQFVEATAYVGPGAAVFPHPLPFHMPLEALRLQFEVWDTSLAQALELFATPAESRREIIGLNPAELSIFTNTAFRFLPEYFGEPAAATIDDLNAAVANAKVFCRRLDVAYMDLHRILQTQFVNPAVDLVPALEGLGVGLVSIQGWYAGDLTDAELLDLLPADLDATPYGGDVVAWLTSHQAILQKLIILAPTAVPPAPGDPPLDDCDFAGLELRLAVADPAADALTALEFHRLNRFIRLWRKLGWSIELTDQLVTRFLPTPPADLTVANIDAAFATLLARAANFLALMAERSVSAKKFGEWLSLFDAGEDAAARRTRLAKLLSLGSVDFAGLVEMSGIDPLAADMEADAPSLLRFVRAWAEVKAGPAKVADLDYLLRHGDPTGKLAPTVADLHTQVRTLRDALTAVDATLGTAPDSADLAYAQAKMALVYDPSVVARFFGLVGRSTTYDGPLLTSEEALPQKLTDVTPALGFDAFKKRLTFTGTMAAATRTALDAAAESLVLADVEVLDTQPELDTFTADVKAAVAAAKAAGDTDVAALHADYPELGTVFDATAVVVDPATQATFVLDGILPALRARLKATALRTGLANLLKVDQAVVDVITAGRGVLHANSGAADGVLADLLGLEQPVALDHDQVVTVHVDPPASDDYILYVAAPAGTQVTLRADGATVIAAGPVPIGAEVGTGAPLPLVAGTPVAVELTIAGLPVGAVAELRWRTKGMAKVAIPASRLTADARLAEATASIRRIGKAVLLQRLLGLTPREVRFLATTAPDTKGVLDDLPVAATATPAGLWDKVARLVWFTALKRETEPDVDTWVDALETTALASAAGQARVAAIGGWRAADVTQALAHLALPATALQRVDTLRSLRRILDFAVTTDQLVADLETWADGDPTAALVTAVRDAVRASLDDAAWRETMQSVNDALRNKRRDALVAYILAHQSPTPAIQTADQLYEHFLVDVQMDACMQTSRIRLALSTVQLFVTRCLMNLESEVSPASIRNDRWQWMKRYRVWEANRKVFLYPENWIEPELRDGKSPFFRELEADLLKSDITDELAEVAYLDYLKKLDDVARLEIVGTVIQQNEIGDQKDDILHVFARTNGKTRQYWHRRFEYGYWTPWEKVPLNVEGDSVFPVLWKHQLYLFWVTAIEKPHPGNQNPSTGMLADLPWNPNSQIDVELTFSWGEFYRGKWVSPKSTNMKRPLVIRGLSAFHPDELVLAARTETPPGLSERLVFSVVYFHPKAVKAFKVVFTTKNAGPMVNVDDPDLALFFLERFNQTLFWERLNKSTLDANSLDVPDSSLILRITQPDNAAVTTVDETVMTKVASPFPGYNVRPVMHPVANQWEAPFFYADEHSTFFVAPDERVETFNNVPVYVPTPDPLILNIVIPGLVERPVVVNPIDPVWNPPWREFVSPTIGNVISDNVTFKFDGVAFGAVGLMQ